jgi:hypothetical protein
MVYIQSPFIYQKNILGQTANAAAISYGCGPASAAAWNNADQKNNVYIKKSFNNKIKFD